MNDSYDSDDESSDEWLKAFVVNVDPCTFSPIKCEAPKLITRLFIGDVWCSRDRDEIQRLDIKSVVSLGCDEIILDKMRTIYLPVEYDTFDGIKYHRITIPDDRDANLYQHFIPVCDFIDKAEGNVLVHCQGGVSRSVSVVIAYLMHSEGLSYNQSLDIVKKCRPCACPNIGFQQQLRKFEEFLKAGIK